jgi:DNA polymerase
MPSNPAYPELIADIREQILYLQDLGVESLSVDLKKLDLPPSPSARMPVRPEAPAAVAPPPRSMSPAVDHKPKPFQSRLGSLPSLASRSVQLPQRPEIERHVVDEDDQAKLFGPVLPVLPKPIETIEQIRADIGVDCSRCKLCSLGRSRVVNSVGNFDADLMFVGEAPGADEDAQGEPFVGRAGQLLTKIIEGIGLKRENVFIGNINRCRPPGNRAPESDESVVCKPFLLREIAVVRPRVIVVLGATAAQNLLETKVPIGKLRGHFHDYMGVKVMPTFHPAYLLRDPHKKREVWEDMKLVRDYLKQG